MPSSSTNGNVLPDSNTPCFVGVSIRRETTSTTWRTNTPKLLPTPTAVTTPCFENSHDRCQTQASADSLCWIKRIENFFHLRFGHSTSCIRDFKTGKGLGKLFREGTYPIKGVTKEGIEKDSVYRDRVTKKWLLSPKILPVRFEPWPSLPWGHCRIQHIHSGCIHSLYLNLHSLCQVLKPGSTSIIILILRHYELKADSEDCHQQPWKKGYICPNGYIRPFLAGGETIFSEYWAYACERARCCAVKAKNFSATVFTAYFPLGLLKYSKDIPPAQPFAKILNLLRVPGRLLEFIGQAQLGTRWVDPRAFKDVFQFPDLPGPVMVLVLQGIHNWSGSVCLNSFLPLLSGIFVSGKSVEINIADTNLGKIDSYFRLILLLNRVYWPITGIWSTIKR